MTVHICRDLVTVNTTLAGQRSPGYVLAIFIRRVLKYSHVGSVGLKIQTTSESGALLVATGDSDPSSTSGTWTSGNRAGINLGSGLEYYVSIPVAARTVIAGDSGKLLVLRSTANPLHNSGVFRISSVDTVNNRYLIDYRSADFPPAEADGSLEWYLYKSDADITWPTTEGTQSYGGWDDAPTYRIILQSPHALGWQVRICGEPRDEAYVEGRVAQVSCHVGFGGDSKGDFAPGGKHTHIALWWNGNGFDWSTARIYDGAGGLVRANISSGMAYRVCVVGDDTGQCVFAFARYTSDINYTSHTIFGICDDEPDATVQSHQRLFTMGQGGTGATPSYSMPSFGIYPGSSNYYAARGTGIGYSGMPISAAYGALGYVYGNTPNANPGFDSYAMDSVWGLTTELFPVDVIVGTWCGTWYYDQTYSVPMPYEPRRVGTAPFIRQGRANFGNWTLTTDKAWYYLYGGMYLQWGGPAVVA